MAAAGAARPPDRVADFAATSRLVAGDEFSFGRMGSRPAESRSCWVLALRSGSELASALLRGGSAP